MEERKTRTGRDEWRKRIERWRENKLSAEAWCVPGMRLPLEGTLLEKLSTSCCAGAIRSVYHQVFSAIRVRLVA